MIDRYCTERMRLVWSEKSKYDTWLSIELALVRALKKMGKLSQEELEVIERRASYEISEIVTLEKELRHDVAAFVRNVEERINTSEKLGRFIHYGITSSDVVDTANAVLCVKSLNILIGSIDKAMILLKALACNYIHDKMMGRTHGQHAVPITFGLKVGSWFTFLKRSRQRVINAKNEIAVGKLSGPVGSCCYLPPSMEGEVLSEFCLTPEPIATQVVARDRYASLVSSLAIMASSIEKICTDIRSLARSEISELSEGYGVNQRGSSCMSHKKNPISCEQLCGLARIMRSYVNVSMENIVLCDERDISNSSVERIMLPDVFNLSHYMLDSFSSIIENLTVNTYAMNYNCGEGEAKWSSGAILLKLIDYGFSRDEAHKLVQSSLEMYGSFDPSSCLDSFDKDDFEKCCDVGMHIRFIELILNRGGIDTKLR